MVPPSGLEPELLSEPHFECGASTNSAKGAHHGDQSNIMQEGAGQADRLDRRNPAGFGQIPASSKTARFMVMDRTERSDKNPARLAGIEHGSIDCHDSVSSIAEPRGALAKIEAILKPHLTPQTQSAENGGAEASKATISLGALSDLMEERAFGLLLLVLALPCCLPFVYFCRNWWHFQWWSWPRRWPWDAGLPGCLKHCANVNCR
jgi:hypothetical protein